jgi:UDP-N-acetylmuramoyl-tripeptide--D-alanyl-D-alanine ligase
MDCEEIIEALATFTPAEGRTRRLQIGDVTVIDDAYNANPSSVLAAVEALRTGAAGRRVFVLGDMLELGPDAHGHHERVVRAISESGIEVLCGVGRAVADAVGRVDPAGMEVVLCEDKDAACDLIPRMLHEGDAVWIKGSRAMQLDKVVQTIIEARRDGILAEPAVSVA